MAQPWTSIALALVATGTAAAEAPQTGFYIGASLDAERARVSTTETPGDRLAETPLELAPQPFTAPPTRSAFDSDRLEFIKTLTAGLELPSGVRVEAEVSYLQHDTQSYRAFMLDNQDIDERERRVTTAEETLAEVGRGSSLDEIVADANGRVRTKAHFANAIYDVSDRTYLGGGIGVAEVDVDYRPGALRLSDKQAQTLAYQVMAGTKIDLSDREGLTLDVRYRLMQGGLSLDGDMPVGAQPDIAEESLTASMGYRFGF